MRPGVLPRDFFFNLDAFKHDFPAFGFSKAARRATRGFFFFNLDVFKRDVPAFLFLNTARRVTPGIS